MFWSAHSMMMMMIVMMMEKDIFIISNTLNWPSKASKILFTFTFYIVFCKKFIY